MENLIITSVPNTYGHKHKMQNIKILTSGGMTQLPLIMAMFFIVWTNHFANQLILLKITAKFGSLLIIKFVMAPNKFRSHK